MSKELGSHYVQAVSQGDITSLHDLFSEDIVFVAATPGNSWHTIGWPETEKALHELYPPGEKVSEIVSVNHHDLPGRCRKASIIMTCPAAVEFLTDCVDISSNMDPLNTNIRFTTTPRATR